MMVRPVFFFSLIVTLIFAASGFPPAQTTTPSPIRSTPTVVPATIEPAPLGLEEKKPFRVQEGSPAWLPNFIHLESGCNWLGVAGQVFDRAGIPVNALVIEVGGTLGGVEVHALSLTGVAPVYGPGGYEVFLGDRTVDSSSALWIQVKDLSGRELTDRVSFDTFSDCSRNLVLINFIESSYEIEVMEYYFPVFYNGVTGSSRRSLENGDSGEDSPTRFFFPVFYNRYLTEPTTTPAP